MGELLVDKLLHDECMRKLRSSRGRKEPWEQWCKTFARFAGQWFVRSLKMSGVMAGDVYFSIILPFCVPMLSGIVKKYQPACVYSEGQMISQMDIPTHVRSISAHKPVGHVNSKRGGQTAGVSRGTALMRTAIPE